MDRPAASSDACLDEIRRFIEGSFGAASREISEDERLLGDVLDSIGVLALANHLEDTYGITIGSHEMDPANFGTLRSIVDFVKRKASAR